MNVPVAVRLFFTAFLLAAPARAAHGQCVIFDAPHLFARSELVFRGTVLSTAPTGITGFHVTVEIATLRVEHAWKGKPGRRISVGADRPFELGKQYVVFASGKPPGTSIECGAAQLVSDANATLEWLAKRRDRPTRKHASRSALWRWHLEPYGNVMRRVE